MKKQLINLFCLVLLAGSTLSCKKAYDDNNLAPLAPSLADIPVTVTNYDVFERFPVFIVPASGIFSVTFSIPSDKGVIKEISRVATGSPYGLVSVQPGLSPDLAPAPSVPAGSPASLLNYNTTTATVQPIAGNGTNTITFSSSIAAYTAYRTRIGTSTDPKVSSALGTAGVAAVPSTNPQAPTQLFYYFLLTITKPDGTNVQVVPEQVRVRVI